MPTIITFDDGARRGPDQLADAAKVTLGPNSHNVVLDTNWGVPTIRADGVCIAKEIELASIKRIAVNSGLEGGVVVADEPDSATAAAGGGVGDMGF